MCMGGPPRARPRPVGAWRALRAPAALARRGGALPHQGRLEATRAERVPAAGSRAPMQASPRLPRPGRGMRLPPTLRAPQPIAAAPAAGLPASPATRQRAGRLAAVALGAPCHRDAAEWTQPCHTYDGPGTSQWNM
jgi:hypothetical protein